MREMCSAGSPKRSLNRWIKSFVNNTLIYSAGLRPALFFVCPVVACNNSERDQKLAFAARFRLSVSAVRQREARAKGTFLLIEALPDGNV